MDRTLAERLERPISALLRAGSVGAVALGLVSCSTQPSIEEEVACAARGGKVVTSTKTATLYCSVEKVARGADAHLGMTTNERLGYFGLLEDFERAAKARDRDAMVAALQGAKFERKAAEGIADTTLANPAKYGF